MSRIEIAAELCKACELCTAFCPQNCIVHSGTLNHYGVYPMRMRDDAACTGCAQCATMCPDAAIEVFRTVAAKTASPPPVKKGQGAETPPAAEGVSPDNPDPLSKSEGTTQEAAP